MVGVTGIEPVTSSMSTKRSPAELYAPMPRQPELSITLKRPMQGRIYLTQNQSVAKLI